LLQGANERLYHFSTLIPCYEAIAQGALASVISFYDPFGIAVITSEKGKKGSYLNSLLKVVFGTQWNFSPCSPASLGKFCLYSRSSGSPSFV
jgi:hypothetical protein